MPHEHLRREADASDLYRGTAAGAIALRADQDGASRLVDITFARFNVWTHIRSYWEGEFLERLTPGAFTDTFRDRRQLIRALFDHGYDPVCGDKALGPVRELAETDLGPTGVVEFLDRPYADDVLAGIREGLYGASYRFGVIEENWDKDPGKSDHNPTGIPERTITRLRVAEFGPVSFPADEGTQGLVTARSLTDHFRAKQDRFDRLTQDRTAVNVEEPPASAQGPTRDDGRDQVATAFARRWQRPA